jgi:hypothetical protein
VYALVLGWLLYAAAVICDRAAVHAQATYGPADTIAAIDEASATYGVSWSRLYWIVRCESGWTFDPYVRGRAGELGVVQLHPSGELVEFYRRGWLDPFSPYQAVAFLAQRLNEGGARAWACA